MGSCVYRNGRFETVDALSLPPDAPALASGFSLFETVRTGHGGTTFRLEAHLDRMTASALALGLAPPPRDLTAIRHAISDLAWKDWVEVGRLRLTLGGTGGDGLFWMTLAPYAPPAEGDVTLGWRGRVLPYKRHRDSPLAGHKTGNHLDAALARASLPSKTEGLLLNDAGRLCEGCYTNLFVVAAGRVVTPSLSEGPLPGITRAALLDLAPAFGLPVEEGEIPLEALPECDEAFLTNALMGLMPLTSVDGHLVGDGQPGPVTQAFASALKDRIAAERK